MPWYEIGLWVFGLPDFGAQENIKNQHQVDKENLKNQHRVDRGNVKNQHNVDSSFFLYLYMHFFLFAVHSIFMLMKFLFLFALDSDRAQIWFVALDSGLVDDFCSLFHFKSPLRPGDLCFPCYALPGRN